MKVMSDDKLEIEFRATGITKSKLAVINVPGQEGRVVRIIDGDGQRLGCLLDNEALRGLQRYLNIKWPPNAKLSRSQSCKVRKAFRVKEICEHEMAKFNKLVQCVCREMELMPEAVLGGRKFRVLSDARMAISYLARRHTDLSYPDLADMFGEKTHASSLIRVREYKKRGYTRIHNGRTLKQIVDVIGTELVVEMIDNSLWPQSTAADKKG